MYMIARPINGISLNGNEFLLDKNGNEMTFKNKEEALITLKVLGFKSEEDAWNNYGVSIWEETDENKI